MNQIFDTHCHYNLNPIYAGRPGYLELSPDSKLRSMSWQDHWQQAQAKGIIASIVPGTSLESNQRAIEIAQQSDRLWSILAIHPDVAVSTTPDELEILQQQAQDETVIGIGETGLDYFRVKSTQMKEVRQAQLELFKFHIELANQLQLPLILHVRDQAGDNQAQKDILEQLKNHYQFKATLILHCVDGEDEYIQEALAMGAYISVAGNVTYPKADQIRHIVQLTPQDKLLVETDAPFLTPQKYRGKPNLPWKISATVEYLQQELDVDPRQLVTNAKEAFRLDFSDTSNTQGSI